jgi:hypothetical protein
MKFKDARVGMEVMVTGEQANKFPEGAVIVDKDDNDNSIRIRSKVNSIVNVVELWFWDVNSSSPKSERHSYDMEDIHLDDKFRSLPSTTLPLAGYLGLNFEKVKCFIDKEKGIIKVKQGCVEAKAKKAPQDKWDFRLGMGLALCHLKEKLTEHQKPDFGEPCYYVLKNDLINHTTVGHGKDFLDDIIMYAMGNTFKTEQLAKDNMEEMVKRTNMIVDFCKKQGW